MKKNIIKNFLQFSILSLSLIILSAPTPSLAQTCLPTGRPDIPYTTTGDELSPTCYPFISNTTTSSSSTSSSSSSASSSSSSFCSATVRNIGDLICKLASILNAIIPLLVAIGVVYFVWGVVRYVIGDGDEAKKKGRDQIIYGLIGFVVILGMWGLVRIVTNTFGISASAPNISNVTSVITANNNGGGCNLGNNPKLQNLLTYVTCIIATSIIPLIFALATVVFIWGVVQYVINDGEEAKKEKGRQFIVWGLIGLVVMISVWGLVKIVGSTFNINTGFIPQLKSQ